MGHLIVMETSHPIVKRSKYIAITMVTGFLSLLEHRKGLKAHYSVSEDEDDDGFTAYNYSIIVSQKSTHMAPYMSDKEGMGAF